MILKLLVAVTLISYQTSQSEAFIPASLLSETILRVDQLLGGSFGKVSDSYPHEEITRRGIINSVARFFYNQPNGTNLINLTRIDNGYYSESLPRVYFDYYGRSVCDSSLNNLLNGVFSVNVARVDFDSSTADLPFAHFDAETFRESNQLVINRTNQINGALNTNDYERARELTGQILHTIQDYYSHSNHVERGITTLNELIGTPQFDNLPIISITEPNACNENCTLISEECGTLVTILSGLINALGFSNSLTQCPLTYYDCSGNIMILDQFLSGYYTGQELSDGTPVTKPPGLIKCSHGGVLDSSSNIPAIGGINKDSGFLIFSPHAQLHLQAANLAVNHTEFYLNQIRSRIGDIKFDQFLEATIDQQTLEGLPTSYTCSGGKLDSLIPLIAISNLMALTF